MQDQPVPDTREAKTLNQFVGARVRALRMQRKITQEQIAARLGVSFQQVQKYEKGVNAINMARLGTIAEVLCVPMETFFDGLTSGGRPRELVRGVTSSEFNDVLGSRDGVKLFQSFVRIADPRLRRALVDLSEVFAEPGQ